MLQLPPSPSDILKEFRNRPPGTLTPRPPEPVPAEAFTKTREKLPAKQFCSIWLRAAISVTFFQGYRQPIMRNCKLAGVLAGTQLLTGVFLTFISFHINTLSPSLKVRDVPIWAGLPLLVTGFYGTLCISCCHKEYPGILGIFVIKAGSFVLSVTALLLCLCSVTFQSIHLHTMTKYTECITDTSLSVSNCNCFVRMDPLDRLYPYKGMNCDDVFTVIRIFFVLTSVSSCLGAIATFGFLILLWGSRYEHFFAGLRPNEDDILALAKL